MDKLDIAIIRELSQEQYTLPAKVGLRSSYRNLAGKLRVSPGTIRLRISKMYASGILRGSSVYANPSLLGMNGGAYATEVSPSLQKHDVIDKMKLIDGMLFIHNFRGNLLGIAFVYDGDKDLQNKLELFKSICGVKEGIFSRIQYPSCTAILTKAEWGLISRLGQGSFETYASLAKELKVPTRTLKRRLAKITSARAIVSSPTLDYRAIEGGVPADLIVVFGDKQTKKETEKKIVELVDDFLVFAGVAAEYVVYNLVLPKMTMLTELAGKIKAIDGVLMVRAELVDEHIDLTNSLEGYVRRKLSN